MTPTRLSIWPPLPPSVYARPVDATLPFPLQNPGCRIFAMGRHALMEGTRSLGLQRGDQVLAPAYNHGSGTEALLRLGVESVFYGGNERLEPVERELDKLLGPRVRAMSLIHYLGFPQDAARWRRWCDERGLFLIEDCAQSWLAEKDGVPVGSHGDIAMFCLYQTFGLPDGAALLSRGNAAVAPTRRKSGLTVVMRRHAAWLATRSSLAASIMERIQSEAPYDATLDFALGDAEEGPTASTLRLLPRVADPAAAAKRRENYRHLLSALPRITAQPFDRLPDGASPFVFPIETDDPQATLRQLRPRGVVGAAFWSAFHPAIPKDRFPSIRARRARTVALPVHQELTAADLDRIVDAVLHARPRGASPAGSGSLDRIGAEPLARQQEHGQQGASLSA